MSLKSVRRKGVCRENVAAPPQTLDLYKSVLQQKNTLAYYARAYIIAVTGLTLQARSDLMTRIIDTGRIAPALKKFSLTPLYFVKIAIIVITAVLKDGEKITTRILRLKQKK